MKKINLLGFFDDHFLLQKLTKLTDPLGSSTSIDLKIFAHSSPDFKKILMIHIVFTYDEKQILICTLASVLN